MSVYRFLLIALLGWCVATPALADIYTWTDGQGVRHYSDVPDKPGAERIDDQLRSIEPRSGADSKSGSPGSSSGSSSTSGAAATTHQPIILSPEPDQTINAGDGLTVSVKVPGGLAEPETLRYRLDGRVLEQAPPKATRLSIDRLGSGRHVLQVGLVDQGTPTGRVARVAFEVTGNPTADSPAQSSSRPAR